MADPNAASETPARALRFGRRLAGEPGPSFADLQRKQRLDRLVADRRERIAELVALLDARPALDAELNGDRLGALANAVGETQFDRLCDAAIPKPIYKRGASTLPLPHLLAPLGEQLLQSHARSADIALLGEIAAGICAASLGRESAE